MVQGVNGWKLPPESATSLLKVETILGRRFNNVGGVEYLIRWRGYDSDWDTWEPGENLGEAQEAVDEFNVRIPLSPTMAANRPARTIKPPNKFLDNDVEVISVNGLPSHVDSSSMLTNAARKLSRSVSLTKEDAKSKSFPKRRAASIETSTEDDSKNTGKQSRQSSLSPSAKLKLSRKSDAEEIPHVNGQNGSVDKESNKSAKLNNVIGQSKALPMTARKQAIPKGEVFDSPSKFPRKSIADTVKLSSKSNKAKTESVRTAFTEITEPSSKSKSSSSKSSDKVEQNSIVMDSLNGAPDVKSGNVSKKKGKPGPKPKPKLNTKNLKSVSGKAKIGLAKTPKATADRVKRKYANKKSTVGLSGAPATKSDNVGNEADTDLASNANKTLGKSGVTKRKTINVAKLATKPGKGKMHVRSKFSKKTTKLKNPSTDEAEHLAGKRPRLKSGPKPKKLKLPEIVHENELTPSESGSSSRSSVDQTIRYKLDGSPCLKPGPKPKKSPEEIKTDQTSQQLASPQRHDKNVSKVKAKPGPKPKKTPSIVSGDTELSKANQLKSKKPSDSKDPQKSKGSPKSKGNDDTVSQPFRKKPGPKPKNTVLEPENSQKEAAQKKDTGLGSVRNKPGPKPKKKAENQDKMDDSSKQTVGLNDAEPIRNKPGPKPKKSLSDSSGLDSPEAGAKKKSTTKLKKALFDKDGSGDKKKLSESRNEGQTLAKTVPVTSSPSSAKLTSKAKSLKSESPDKAKPGSKLKRALTESNKSSKTSPTKQNTDSPKILNKKSKKGTKRKASSSNAERQDSTSDESDTLYSLVETERKKMKLDGTDSATSSDSEVVLKRPNKTSPSPRKMLLKDSIRPKHLDSETDAKKSNSLPPSKSPSKSAPPGVFKKMASVTAPGTSQDAQQHNSGVEVKLGVYMKDLPTMPVIPNMMPTSPLAASHKNLMKTLNQGKVAAGRNKRHPSNSSEEEEGIVERRVSVRQSESAFRYKEIVVKKCPGYTQIWLFTSTKIKNSLNPKVFQELREALKNARFDDSKLVMLSGSGSVFCSGIDLHYLMDEDRRMAAKKMTDAMKEFIQAVVSFPKPIVAAVNGAAIGLGVAILPLCDIIYASDKASFSCPYSRLAQTPEGCATQTFPSVMGMAMANELLLGGRKLTAIEAYQIGLVSQVFWPTSMMQEVIPRIQNMASFSSRALEQSKLLMRSTSRPKLEFAAEAECQNLLERWASAECHRAFRTYLDEEQDLLV